MTSEYLSGFSIWQDWSRSVPENSPTRPGVYAFKLGKFFGRLKGQSDLLYIGCTEKRSLRRRLRDHLSESAEQRSVGYRLGLIRREHPDLKVAWLVCDTADRAKELEVRFLDRYDVEHFELPPLNRKLSGKTRLIAERALRTVLEKQFPNFNEEKISQMIEEIIQKLRQHGA